MDTLAAISRWLGKQHVVTWCVARDDEPMPFTFMTRKRSPFICLAMKKRATAR